MVGSAGREAGLWPHHATENSVTNAGRNWDRDAALREMLGYSNFSEGRPDARFQQNIDAFCRHTTAGEPWRELHAALSEHLAAVQGTTAAFSNLAQAKAVIALVFDHVLPAYQRHHADLLFHLNDCELFQPFLIARVFEVVLAEGGAWQKTARIVQRSLERLNCFIGHRPVAVLENRRRNEPYEHERVRPIPLFIRGAGVACGRYHDLVAAALETLERADPAVCADAHFNLELLDELALDPRAYDFRHPVNQRPNYQFGEWDSHCLDNQARYRRFVLRQVTLDALVERVEEASEAEHGETLLEAAAVLAGTMLMASGTSGSGPDTHDSLVTLATLVPKIAQYRDAFYASLIQSMTGPHGERLRREAAALHQPFGAARQHLNQSLARRRAAQLQAVHLARLFAQMGYPAAAQNQARIVATASTRMLCDLECRLTAARLYLDRGELPQAGAASGPIADLLHRGIACGAMVDPWNILGFQGQFSIFPAIENSVPDPRVEQLAESIEEIFGLHARLLVEAAAAGDAALEQATLRQFRELAAWWDQFATVEVSGIRRVHGGESLESATHVARSLAEWRRAGEAAGDIKFWRQHTEGFTTPRAYFQVISALLDKRDHLAAMALLVNWLTQVNDVSLGMGEQSFHALAVRWLVSLDVSGLAPDRRWSLIKRFFDFLEANADDFWQVPSLDLGRNIADDAPDALRRGVDAKEPETDADADDAGDVYEAAYDGVTFHDSAEDGHEGDMLEGGPPDRNFELEFADERLQPRLQFLLTRARLWELAATITAARGPRPARGKENAASNRAVATPDRESLAAPLRHPEQLAAGGQDEEFVATIQNWQVQLQASRRDLARLLDAVHEQAIPQPIGAHDAMVEYDRRRSIKEQLTHAVIAAQVETVTAIRRLSGGIARARQAGEVATTEERAAEFEQLLRGGNAEQLREKLPAVIESLATEPILYCRLDRGGRPSEIVAARSIQQWLRELVQGLPRVGLLRETIRVLRTARAMEQQHPVRGEGVTEFDQLFRTALRAAGTSVLESAAAWPAAEQADSPLLDCLEKLAEPFVQLWVDHSKTVRLSVLDRVAGDAEWRRLRQFIERYGHDLLTPKFLTFANLRAIADQGAARYLQALEDDRDPLQSNRLLDELDGAIRRAEAAHLLELLAHVFIENYAEYRDYNTTTAQSDYGERFFVLFEFLRLKAMYDRTSWNLQPVLIVHELLARHGRHSAAREWQEALDEKTVEVADSLLRGLAELESHFGVRVATVRERLAERFTRPLALDRARALVEPAIDQTRQPSESPAQGAFDRFCDELREFTETPAGAGLEVPPWLRRLEAEVEQARNRRASLDDSKQVAQSLPGQRPVSRSELLQQLESLDDPGPARRQF